MMERKHQDLGNMTVVTIFVICVPKHEIYIEKEILQKLL